jgi:octanoyl-[GcvH]:protein N-octanoyltransferase
VEILTAGPFENPEDGFGLQQAILEEVASGGRGPTALAWSSSPYVGATRPETRLGGFAAAARVAEESGFPVLVRNSGGGAVAANGGSLSFSLTVPVGDLRHGLYERYADGVELVASALRRVGVEAEGGEVEGEFCPGAYSVRSGGRRGVKHAGLAQRVTRRAARLEALVLVEDTGPVREALARFYGGLGRPFRPSCVADLPARVPDVVEALSEEVRRRHGGRVGSVGAGTLEKARALREGWRFIPETGSSL